jgi:hypothetical protein
VTFVQRIVFVTVRVLALTELAALRRPASRAHRDRSARFCFQKQTNTVAISRMIARDVVDTMRCSLGEVLDALAVDPTPTAPTPRQLTLRKERP